MMSGAVNGVAQRPGMFRFYEIWLTREMELRTMENRGFPPGANVRGGRNAAPVHAEMADAFYAHIIPIVVELRRQGQSLRVIARELDKREIRTRVGCYY